MVEAVPGRFYHESRPQPPNTSICASSLSCKKCEEELSLFELYKENAVTLQNKILHQKVKNL